MNVSIVRMSPLGSVRNNNIFTKKEVCNNKESFNMSFKGMGFYLQPEDAIKSGDKLFKKLDAVMKRYSLQMIKQNKALPKSKKIGRGDKALIQQHAIEKLEKKYGASTNNNSETTSSSYVSDSVSETETESESVDSHYQYLMECLLS